MTTAAFGIGAQMYAVRPLCIDASGHRYRPTDTALSHGMCERCGDVQETRKNSLGATGAIPSPEGQVH